MMRGNRIHSVFLGLSSNVGYHKYLSRGLRRLGIKTTWIQFEDSFGYGEDDSASIPVFRWWKKSRALEDKAWRWIEATTKMKPLTLFKWVSLWRLFHILSGILSRIALRWAARNHDAFIFIYNSSFAARSCFSSVRSFDCDFDDLRLLKKMGRKIGFICCGSDVRPPYLDGHIVTNSAPTPEQLAVLSRDRKRVVKTIEKYADVSLDMPSQALFRERPFVRYDVIGRPFEAEIPSGDPPARDAGAPIRVVHIPSFPKTKGTVELRAIMERLRARGYSFDFIELTGVPNSQVLAELRRCDFVVDQLYSDRAMSCLVEEAAFFGKPSLIAGYYATRYEAECAVAGVPIPPALFVEVEKAEEAIERLLTDERFRADLGSRAQKFVREYWNPEAVAGRWIQALEGSAPKEWWCDPSQLGYLHGMGISEAQSSAAIAGLLKTAGSSALQLDDKPALRDAMIARAGKFQ